MIEIRSIRGALKRTLGVLYRHISAPVLLPFASACSLLTDGGAGEKWLPHLALCLIMLFF
jgi:hypothetical protein